ncbi:metalloregulator ArsR/SmtB family transcription factor [Maricaulis sp.]|uniref:ArsR/SmtB family transcription factor n=1 Tax=unclassified Maricaulis TaxID=2632371 RepID=UPI001B11418E|nr:metalloregulator ArsR/SmtB family transcription factor [Maricaulis sp.]MBO6795583.1 helix-turn-helix transcriptional regulator [Maricaulis sp.]
MTDRLSISGFSALSHPVRLALFRTLCQRAPDTVSAGELASGFDIPPSTMTGHLQALERAGLIRSQRRSRFMLYSLDHDGTRQFLTFLLKDCCGDQPDLLAGLVENNATVLQEAS